MTSIKVQIWNNDKLVAEAIYPVPMESVTQFFDFLIGNENDEIKLGGYKLQQLLMKDPRHLKWRSE